MVKEQAAIIILAGGSSSRMNGIKKEHHILKNGLSVLETALSAFASVQSVKTIVIVTAENMQDETRRVISPAVLNSHKPEILFVNGGSSRRASVFNALNFLASDNHYLSEIKYVLIHDGARPWISSSLIEKTIEAVKQYDAVIPVMPITDTPKELEYAEQGRGNKEQVRLIKNHLKRADTVIAQTPQGFKFPQIFFAHEKAAKVDEDFTDDAEIWGRFCGKVAVIPGDPENKKITFPEDLV